MADTQVCGPTHRTSLLCVFVMFGTDDASRALGQQDLTLNPCKMVYVGNADWMYTCELLRDVRVELLGLGNVGPESCCIQQLNSVCAFRGMTCLMHAQHMITQRPILQI